MPIRTRAIATLAAALAAVTLVPGGPAAADGTTDDVYGYADFYGVPHLGYETASGTGCGGDGSVGDVIADGYWRGYIRNLRATDFDFDLVCVYGNDVNPDLIAEWAAQHPGETQPWVPDGFLVNNSDRTRVVAVAEGFFTHGTAWAGTSCPFNDTITPFDQARDTWIRIVAGRAVWAVSSCAGVPSGPVTPPSTGFTFPYPGFYDVPRLGTEEVLGTGCGGNGSLGATIPDGFWFGWVEALGPTSLEFDVACIYIGSTAARLEQEWLSDAAQQADDPSPYFGGGWWLVNNNERTRTVPLAPGFVVAGANVADPAAPDPNWPGVAGFDYACVPPLNPTIQPPYAIAGSYNYTGSWLYIAGGQAQYALLECPHD